MALPLRALAGILSLLASQAMLLSGEEASKGKEGTNLHNGLKILATSKGELTAGGTVEVTIALENHNKIPIQTLIPPGDMCNVVWNLSFEPAIHEEMGGHSTIAGVNYDKVATIEPGKSVEFTFEVKRKKGKVYVASKCGKFGCLSEPVKIPKGTKELKLFYRHEDRGAQWRDGEFKIIPFSEKRWKGELKSAPVVIEVP